MSDELSQVKSELEAARKRIAELESPNLDAKQRAYVEAVVAGQDEAVAYGGAYGCDKPDARRQGAFRMSRNVTVQAEIRRLRDLAQEKAGSAVMTNVERRSFLAEVKRTPLAALSPHHPVVSEWKVSKPWKKKEGEGEQMELWEDVSIKKPDPVAAIALDAKLSGELVDEVQVKGLGELVSQIRSKA